MSIIFEVILWNFIKMNSIIANVFKTPVFQDTSLERLPLKSNFYIKLCCCWNLWLLKCCKIQSLLLYVFSVKLFIFSIILFVFSPILFIFSHILYIFSLILFFAFSLTYHAAGYRATYTASRKFRNNQIEIREIVKYKNTKIQKIEYWIVIRILWKKEKHGKRWKNYILYTLLVAQSNFILMILLINQWYLESRKSHII